MSLTSLWPSKIDLQGHVAHAYHFALLHTHSGALSETLFCCVSVSCAWPNTVCLHVQSGLHRHESSHDYSMTRVLFNLCRQHFQLKKGVVQQQMQEWLAKADKTTNKPVKEAVTAIKAELERLSVDTVWKMHVLSFRDTFSLKSLFVPLAAMTLRQFKIMYFQLSCKD